MYFYVYNGRLYWGRYQSIAPRRHVTTWIFRNKPVKTCHIYMTGRDSFIARSAPESRIGAACFHLMISSPVSFGNKVFHEAVIEEGYCYYLDRHGWRTVASTDKNEVNRNEFRNMFRNRLKEYKGRYFLPIDKHANYA